MRWENRWTKKGVTIEFEISINANPLKGLLYSPKYEVSYIVSAPVESAINLFVVNTVEDITLASIQCETTELD